MDIVVTPINRELFQCEEAIFEVLIKLRRARAIEANNLLRVKAVAQGGIATPRHLMLLQAEQNRISDQIQRIENILNRLRQQRIELLSKSNQQSPA